MLVPSLPESEQRQNLADNTRGNTGKSTESKFISDLYKRKQKSVYEDELEAYLAEDIEEPETDILTYWKYKSKRWPRMAAMAQDVLAVTATSASSERSFSTGRDLLGISRHSLLPESMEACICLRSFILSGVAEDGDIPEVNEQELNDCIALITAAERDEQDEDFHMEENE